MFPNVWQRDERRIVTVHYAQKPFILLSEEVYMWWDGNN